MKNIIYFLSIVLSLSAYAQPFPAGGYQGGTHGNRLPVQQIQIFEGWSGTSSYINPKEPAMTTLLEMIEDELIIFYDEENVIWPGQSIWDIDEWDSHSGYVIKVNDDCVLEVKGLEDDSQAKNVHQGWNLIPVLCDQPVSVEDLCAELDSLEVVSAVAGNGVYWAKYGINTLNYLWPGKSYWLYTYVTDVLDFGQPALKAPHPEIYMQSEVFAANPWNPVHLTPLQHTIGISSEAMENFNPGDILGMITEPGTCCGAMKIEDISKPAGLNVFGNDPLTAEKDGFDADEKILFQLYSAETDEITNLTPVYEQPEETGQFREKGFTMITGFKVEPTEIYAEQQRTVKIYPNPGHGIFNIEGVNQDDAIVIVDLLGEVVYQKPENVPETINLSSFSPGIYLVKIKTALRQYHIKLVYN